MLRFGRSNSGAFAAIEEVAMPRKYDVMKAALMALPTVTKASAKIHAAAILLQHLV
jgi:hypothetical protein